VAFINPEDLLVRKPESVDLIQVVPLLLAAVLLTIGLSIFLTGTENAADLVQPVIVVFGGTIVAMLAAFPLSQLATSLQLAVDRGIRGGTAPQDMIKAMMQVCEISRRDGLLGVGEVQSDSPALRHACNLICDAANEQQIQIKLDKQRTSEQLSHRMSADVFLFSAVFASLIGGLGSIIRALSNASMLNVTAAPEPLSIVMLPLVCGVSLSLLMTILLGRLRTAHLREAMAIELALFTPRYAIIRLSGGETMSTITVFSNSSGRAAYRVVPNPDDPVILQIDGKLCRVLEISATGFACPDGDIKAGRRYEFKLDLPTSLGQIAGYVDVLPERDDGILHCLFVQPAVDELDRLHHYVLVRQKEALRGLKSNFPS